MLPAQRGNPARYILESKLEEARQRAAENNDAWHLCQVQPDLARSLAKPSPNQPAPDAPSPAPALLLHMTDQEIRTQGLAVTRRDRTRQSRGPGIQRVLSEWSSLAQTWAQIGGPVIGNFLASFRQREETLSRDRRKRQARWTE